MTSLIDNLYVLYEYDFFLSIKSQVTIEDTLKIEINKIFDGNYESNYNKNVNTFYNNYASNKNFHHKKKEKEIVRKVKNKKLELFSLLNKLTKANFTNTLNEINNIVLKDKNLLLEIIDDFWKFCYKQAIFSIMYIEILKKILSSHDDEFETVVIEKLKNIIHDFINKDVQNKNNISTEDYDAFCENNIAEKYIKGKYITICWIIQNTTFEILSKQQLLQNIQKQSLENEIILDILQIYNTIIGLDSQDTNYLISYKENNKITSKNKFKLLNIIENRPFQMEGFTITVKKA